MSLGKIFLVPTPIGNLKDITLRALEALENSDEIAAEDTRQTLKLLNHFNIKKPLFSYHQHNEQGKSDDIIDKLKDGKNIALVTDAGTPGISDPGSVIVQKCIEQEIPFEVLPGATAFTTALVYSGLDTTKFVFRGFIPRENKDRKALMEEVKDKRETVIFYESPHRIKKTLNLMLDILGDRNIALCREITKKHEEIIRGHISEIISIVEELKGEMVIVVEGSQEVEEEITFETTIKEDVDMYIEKGMSTKDAIKEVAKQRNLNKNSVYQEYHSK